MNWFEETLEINEGRAVKIAYSEHLHSRKSDFQQIDVYQTQAFGKMLVHDGVIMLTESDEKHYHEMIVHVALNTHPNPKKVLVIGGGDGGTLKEVLRHPEVAEAHLCEIDDQVCEVAKEYFPDLAAAFEDPRAQLFFEDGAAFVENRPNEYDVIIVDSSDPIGPAEVLFQEKFYRAMNTSLKSQGIIVTQSESMMYHGEFIEGMAEFCKKIFPVYKYYYTMVPTYPSGMIGFSFCSKELDPIADFQEDKVEALGEMKYYTSGIHKASFELPAFFNR